MPESEKKKKLSRRDKGLRYPVEFVAAELGVDRKTLERRVEASGFHLNGAGLTFREAYKALSEKFTAEAALRRKNNAAAENAELDALLKRKTFIELGVAMCSDVAVKTRVAIEGADYIPLASRHRLIKEVAEIKPSVSEEE